MRSHLAVLHSYQVRYHGPIPGCADPAILAIINGLWRDMADGGGYVSGRLTAKTTPI